MSEVLWSFISLKCFFDRASEEVHKDPALTKVPAEPIGQRISRKSRDRVKKKND